MVVVNGGLSLLVILSMQVVSSVGRRSGLPGRHVQMHLHIVIRIQGIQRRGDGKDCAPLPPEWGVRWACLAIFFLDLGLGEVCTGDAWNLPSEGTGLGGFGLVSEAEDWHWSVLISCMFVGVLGQTRTPFVLSAPQPPQQQPQNEPQQQPQ